MESERTELEEEAGPDDSLRARRTGGWCEKIVFAAFLGLLGAVVVLLALFLMCKEESQAADDCFHALYAQKLAKAKYIDLTHSFGPSTPVWPGFGPSSAAAGQFGKDIPGFAKAGEEMSYGTHGFVVTRYGLVTDQLGTQLDPPSHWNEYGATISDLPATFTLRPLCVVQIQDKVAADPGYAATVADITDWEARHGRVPEGAVVFFRSDWSRVHNWGITGGADIPEDAPFPGVSLAALKFLHLERGILMHGHEPLDTDSTPNLEGEAWLMHHDFAQAEGVANLHQVPESGCLVSIGFAKPQGGTGGYARYVAVCPPGTPAGYSVADAPGAPLQRQQAPLRRGTDGVMRPAPGAEPTPYCESSLALGCSGGGLVS
eukprot:TRINITY_DN48051_c0_g1_i1.p1 TRINITY_DN48051_c0_g1~~TRINITY_DN48051_c0_g1_i1.p1  ORF type:complete len:374 (+),score=65.42 TRINITY_DN48051_c0_g1_i1:68-1189(+)